MQIRTRFIIPVDGAAPDPPPTPHFDSATANSARPVRPLVESEETVVARRVEPVNSYTQSSALYEQPPVVMYAPPRASPAQAAGRRSPWRAVLVTFVIFGAVAVGLAGGYGIAHYPELVSPEPIAAAAELRDRPNQPDPEFTAPPEDTSEDPVVFDPDANTTDDPSDEDQVQVPHQPRNPRDQDPSVAPPRDNRQDPAQDPEGIRQRRVNPPNEPGTTANHRPRNNRDRDDSTGARIRRTGDGLAERIREIFGGKP